MLDDSEEIKNAIGDAEAIGDLDIGCIILFGESFDIPLGLSLQLLAQSVVQVRRVGQSLLHCVLDEVDIGFNHIQDIILQNLGQFISVIYQLFNTRFNGELGKLDLVLEHHLGILEQSHEDVVKHLAGKLLGEHLVLDAHGHVMTGLLQVGCNGLPFHIADEFNQLHYLLHQGHHFTAQFDYLIHGDLTIVCHLAARFHYVGNLVCHAKQFFDNGANLIELLIVADVITHSCKDCINNRNKILNALVFFIFKSQASYSYKLLLQISNQRIAGLLEQKTHF